MNLREFFNATIKNGGASYNLTTGELNPNKGYFVSVAGSETKIPFSQFSEDHIKDFVNANAIALSDANCFVGSWIEHNTVYLDISEQLFDKRIALTLGLQRNQLAIYDAVLGKVIDLPTERQTTGTLTQQRAYITSMVNSLS
jgi:hypothetical protein